MPVLFGLALAPGAALAGGVACLRCTGPDRIYRCEVTGDAAVPGGSVGLFCASRIAGERGHQSCAAQRGAQDCDGVPVTYANGEGAILGITAAREPPPGAGEADDGEPRTLGEITKDAVSGSADAVKKAGENIGSGVGKAGKVTADAIKDAGTAIGDATKKTLKCLGSALNDC